MRPNNHAVSGLMLLLISVITVSCGGEVEQDREPAVKPVKLITLSSASEVEMSRYPAVVDSGQSADLSFQVGGLIDKFVVTQSQVIEEGDVIARLDQRDFQNKLTAARSQFANAEEEYQRSVRLAEADAIARSVLDQRKSQRDVARTQFDSAEKALADAVLRAPFPGVITVISAREKETVTAGQTVAAIMGHGGFEVTIDLPARVIAESQEVEDRGSFVILDAAPGTKFPATFKEANLLADATSQTYEVTFTFEPPANLVILPGMGATVELSSARRANTGATNRISIPLSAIASDDSSTYVWVVNEDTMTVSKREVTVADGVGNYAVVTEGLELGETIATAGASYLADGMKVRPWTK